ncbi:MAG: hypothetical protein P0116_11320 [Candidatus Nitrosocosmicus sp.]|nr:hypothetical protein [Candidatus Nitrosocosmicus sp.]
MDDGVDRHFGKATDDSRRLIGVLRRSTISAFDDVASRARSAADAVGRIGGSASDARSEVDRLIFNKQSK